MSNCTLFDDAPTPKPADLTKPVDGVGCGCGCDSFACSPLNAVAPVDRVAPLVVVVAELPVGSSSSHWLNKANVVKWLQAQSECVLFEAASLQPSVSQSLRARVCCGRQVMRQAVAQVSAQTMSEIEKGRLVSECAWAVAQLFCASAARRYCVAVRRRRRRVTQQQTQPVSGANERQTERDKISSAAQREKENGLSLSFCYHWPDH